jgi:hypothetical protein
MISTEEPAASACATAGTTEMAEIADAVPVGAVVGRRLNRLIWRSEPSGGAEQ